MPFERPLPDAPPHFASTAERGLLSRARQCLKNSAQRQVECQAPSGLHSALCNDAETYRLSEGVRKFSCANRLFFEGRGVRICVNPARPRKIDGIPCIPVGSYNLNSRTPYLLMAAARLPWLLASPPRRENIPAWLPPAFCGRRQLLSLASLPRVDCYRRHRTACVRLLPFGGST